MFAKYVQYVHIVYRVTFLFAIAFLFAYTVYSVDEFFISLLCKVYAICRKNLIITIFIPVQHK